MSTHYHSETKKPSCGGCEHGHGESPLPQRTLVITAGILTGFGLVLGWMNIGPTWLGTVIFALATLAGLWLAILADTGATLLVIMNSLRLLAAPKGP